jgi:UDP-GlcNAc:undecaprenyl-phosphate GlcNAc-1-phosphate transferase
LRRGLNPLTHPGTDHTSHRLVARGLTRREAVLTLYLASGALGVVAMFCAQGSLLTNYVLLALVAATGVIALYELEFRKRA